MNNSTPCKKVILSLICLLILAPFLYGEELKENKIEYPDSCQTELYPASDEFVSLDEEPTISKLYAPSYPPIAEKAGVKKADVWVRVLVDKCGNVKKSIIQIPSGNKSGFDEAAVEAADKCKFNPGILEGEPVACWVTYKFEFRKDLVSK